MADQGGERLTGDLKAAEGVVVAPGVALTLDKLGAIHVAAFRLAKAKTLLAGHDRLVFETAAGRKIELGILADGFMPDGAVRAAVVDDSGQPGYGQGLGLGLDLGADDSADDEDE